MKRPKHEKRIVSKKALTLNEEHALEDFIEKALVAFDKEDIEHFVLTLHRNHRDINYFGNYKKEIEDIFDALIKDTKRHAELVEHVIKLCD